MSVELKYPKLFEPMRLGKFTVKNRLFASAQDYPGLTAERFVTEQGAYFYERKAQGGFSTVCVGDYIVQNRTHPFQMRGADLRGKVNLGRIATGIKRHNALASIELCDGGKNAALDLMEGGTPGFAWGPSDGIRPDGVEVRAMNDEQIEALIQRYIDAASFAVQCGFNMLMLHAGHGWQMHQFLSPTDNQRTDKWGGSPENRARFVIEVLDGIRKEVGRGIPLEVKISAKEFLPGGYDLDEGIAIAKMLDEHCDLINVSAGHHEHPVASNFSSPTMFHGEGMHIDMAAAIKKELKHAGVSAIGSFTDPDFMEACLEEGKCDGFQIARQTLADPDFPIKARKGDCDSITPCIRCFNCFHNSVTMGTFLCAVNPEIGREVVGMLHNNKAAVQKKVSIIGGGPAGMQAALTCAEQGHDVILFEKEAELGGCLLMEKDVDFKVNLEKYLKRQEKKCLNNPKIEVRLNTAATPEMVEADAPDVVISAIGSEAIKLPIPGIDKAVCADDVYRNTDLAGQNVVIMGGGLVGLEMAVHLCRLGRECTVVEMAPGTCATPATPEKGTSEGMSGIMHMPAGYPLVQGGAIACEMLEQPKMHVKCSTRAMEVTDEGLMVDEKGVGEHLIPADTVIYAVGQRPLTAEANSFANCAYEFHAIGDCVDAATIYNATSTAYQIALDIGRDI